MLIGALQPHIAKPSVTTHDEAIVCRTYLDIRPETVIPGVLHGPWYESRRQSETYSSPVVDFWQLTVAVFIDVLRPVYD